MNDTLILFNNSFENEFLSSFSDHPIVIDGVEYPTVQHFYQSQKFMDIDVSNLIKDSRSVREAVHLGHFRLFNIKENWDRIKFDVMYRGMIEKFTQYPELKKSLLATANAKLIYTIPNDYWGRGKNYSGRNMEGLILMMIRHKFNTEMRK